MPRFVSPPDPAVYKARAWEIARQIPPGRVFTYGQVAALIPTPGSMSREDYLAWGARWVGGAMAACPDGVPWQRVLNAQGKISLPADRGGERQRQLLEAEGVVFDERGRIDLKKFGWEGPAREWLLGRGFVAPAG
ncbi:MAG: MGMT family protein [Chloroflexi bacterium]|nr:MGMT family protein [Chloroflexota bacterium]